MLSRRLVATAVTVVLLGCATSPTGRRQLILLPEAQVETMGIQAFEQMRAQQRESNDPAVNAYVRCVTDPIVAALPRPWSAESWEVAVFVEDSANAFALPGGKIGVHTGMFDVARTDAQLASVIGHEIGHVISRHSNERVSETLAAQGGLAIAGALTEDDPRSDLIMAALGLGAQVGYLLPHSRTQESEADVVGLELMARAGFDPSAAVELWHNMSEAAGGQPPQFLSTHPSHGSRIAELEAALPRVLPLYEQARARGRAPSCPAPGR